MIAQPRGLKAKRFRALSPRLDEIDDLEAKEHIQIPKTTRF